MVFKLPMRLIHPIHHPLAVWQVELFPDFQKCNTDLKGASTHAIDGVVSDPRIFENVPGIEVPGVGKSRSGTG